MGWLEMAVETKKDGRIVRTGADYTQFRRDLYVSQHGKCSECGRNTSLTVPIDFDCSFHVDHLKGRGMGGSRRNDIPSEVTGRCASCHRHKHNQG